ncbi:hypothetical protein CSIV_04900 [Microbacterium sp. CSI-V]|uniref:hypothetical protein n=1 Tax=Microbacterium sp. CSI-V TaxID=1933777 RepID=UPI00097BAF15|nr:hypothetical protein [Microbacterium sp. CSI-V]ONI65620.1 hypothetical protein CSIV_04900 [Microbacterium sp. CSI-V]
MLTPSLPTEAPTGLSAAAHRRIEASSVVRSAAGVPRVGVVAWTTDPIVTGTTDLAMTYQIAPFVAVTARNSAGAERVANDSAVTVSTSAAPGSNSRIDVIWVRCLFPLAGDTGTAPLFGVTQGVANASPSKPSIPAGALELATARVTSSDLATQTAVITQTVPYTAAPGGVVWLRNASEMAAWVPDVGALAWRLDTSNGYQYLGSTIGWVHVSGKPEIGAYTGSTIYSAGGTIPRVLGMGGRIYAEGNIVSTSATFTAGDPYTIGSIPAAFAPKVALIQPAITNIDGLVELTVQPSGVLVARLSKSFTGTLALWLAGSWPDKRLV